MWILLNVIWILFGWFLSAAGWLLTGLLWCMTIIGITIGIQCFKFSLISFDPFGKEIVYNHQGAGSFLMNGLWIVFGGFAPAALNFLPGVLLCVTIIGIPFGKQYFRISKLSLVPFGAEVIRTHIL